MKIPSRSAPYDAMEDVAQSVVADSVAYARELVIQFGGRPFGYEDGNKWDVLESYVLMRGDANAWLNYIQDWCSVMPLDEAVLTAWMQATKMERRLEQAGGVDAVLAAKHEERVKETEKVFKEADRLEDMPRPVIVPTPLPEMLFDPLSPFPAEEMPA